MKDVFYPLLLFWFGGNAQNSSGSKEGIQCLSPPNTSCLFSVDTVVLLWPMDLLTRVSVAACGWVGLTRTHLMKLVHTWHCFALPRAFRVTTEESGYH